MTFEKIKFPTYLFVIVYGSTIDPLLALGGVAVLVLSFRTCDRCAERICTCDFE